MAAPVDASRVTTNIATAATSHNVNVGSPAAGELVLVAVRFGGAPGTVTFTGYTLLASSTADASDDETRIYWRKADGLEGATDVLTTSASQKLAAIAYRITGAADPAVTPPQTPAAAIATTAANAANPPPITPAGGAAEYLFVVLGGLDGEVVTFTAPSGYANIVQANSGTGGQPATNAILAGASRQATTATEDPAAFTHAAATTGCTAYTIAVAAPPPPPAVTGFAPSGGAVGATVVITGSAFTGASSVTFAGVSSSYVVDSATQITATVPAGASSGTIAVTTPNGTGTSAGAFTVLVPPPLDTPYALAVLADAPVAYYRMTETGGIIQDASGNGNHATVVAGTPSYAQASPLDEPGDTAVGLLGYTEWFTVPDHSTLDVGDVFTLEAWVKRVSLGGSRYLTVIHKGASSFQFFVDEATARPQIHQSGVAYIANGITGSLDDLEWHHIAVTKSGATVLVYTDGIAGGAGGGGTLSNTATPLEIGTAGASSTYAANLYVDEVAVYPTALSADRIRAHYLAGGGDRVPHALPLAADFELGVDDASVKWVDPGSPRPSDFWDSIELPAGAAITYDNEHALGDMAVRILPGSGAANTGLRWTHPIADAGATYYCRLYLWLTAYPSPEVNPYPNTFGGYGNGDTGVVITNEGKVSMFAQGSGAVWPTPVPLNQWIRLEWEVVVRTTFRGSVAYRVYWTDPDGTTPDATGSLGGAVSEPPTFWRVGAQQPSPGASWAPFWIDEVVVGATTWPGPRTLPAAYVPKVSAYVS